MSTAGLAEMRDEHGWFLTEEAVQQMQLALTVSNPQPVYPSAASIQDDEFCSPLHCWRHLEDEGWRPEFSTAHGKKSKPPYTPGLEGSPKVFYISSMGSSSGRVLPMYLQCLACSDKFAIAYHAQHAETLSISHAWGEIQYQSLIRSGGKELKHKKTDAATDTAAIQDDDGGTGMALTDEAAMRGPQMVHCPCCCCCCCCCCGCCCCVCCWLGLLLAIGDLDE
jgi:hypothetical protein